MGDWVRDEVLVSICNTTLIRATMNFLMLDMQVIKNGDGVKGKRFDGPELRTTLGQLEMELKQGPKGGWFMGNGPGRANIMLEYPMSFIKQRNYVDLKKDFRALVEWLDRV